MKAPIVTYFYTFFTCFFFFSLLLRVVEAYLACHFRYRCLHHSKLFRAVSIIVQSFLTACRHDIYVVSAFLQCHAVAYRRRAAPSSIDCCTQKDGASN